MLPVPSVARRAARILTEHDCDTVLFGAAAPLGLLAPSLRQAGARRVVALTHGHEAGWAGLPGAPALLRRIGDQADGVPYLGGDFRTRLARAVSAEAAARMVRLAPGVDTGVFRAGAGGSEIRERLGLGNRPVVVCVSRMVPRKGQDTLIRAWPRVLAEVAGGAEMGGGPVLMLVGDGPYRADLGRLARRTGVSRSVVFTGAVPLGELPAHYDARDGVAMPCRTPRRRPGGGVNGLDIGCEVLRDHVPADLERRREVAVVLGEVRAQDAEAPDGLGAGHRLVGVVHGQLDFGDQLRIIAQLGWCGVGRASVLLLPELQRLGVQGDQAGDVRPGVADHDALADQRVGAEPVLEHGGRHVLAASGDDEFLLPPGDPQEALLVHAADIAAQQPALMVQDLGRRGLVVPVSGGDVPAPEQDLPAVRDLDCDARQGQARR